MYLVGSFVLVSLAGCGRGFFQSAEREPWRAEAEVACLKSGAVKESPELVRIDPISGPGACGAQFPLKVAALGEGSGSFGFADESAAARQYRQPAALADSSRRRRRIAARQDLFRTTDALRQPNYARAVQRADFADARRASHPQEDEIDLPAEGTPQCATRAAADPMGAPAYPPRDRYPAPSSATLFAPPYSQPPAGGQPCRGSGPRRAIPSTRSARSR